MNRDSDNFVVDRRRQVDAVKEPAGMAGGMVAGAGRIAQIAAELQLDLR